jgi:hypothetical protein
VEEGSRQFLPPQPAGPDPELGSRPPQPGGWQEPAGAQPVQGGWQQPAAAQPDNGPAVAGFVLSIVSGALLIVSAGLSSVVSVGCAIAGIVYSRKGKRKVEAGETSKNAGLAQAGFIIGIVSLCLAVLATLIWTIVLIAAISDPEFRDDLEREFDNAETVRAVVRLAVALVA